MGSYVWACLCYIATSGKRVHASYVEPMRTRKSVLNKRQKGNKCLVGSSGCYLRPYGAVSAGSSALLE